MGLDSEAGNGFLAFGYMVCSWFQEVDTATNYPIDKNPDHFRLAEKLLHEWSVAHGVSDLRVMMKVGSVNNLFTPEHILKESFILMMIDEYSNLFRTNLDTVMVHWDNREDESEIRETFEALSTANQNGFRVGLSGIRYPDTYAQVNQEFGYDFRIQMKHNVLHSDYQRYKSFHGKKRFIAYGINAGGIKLNKSAYAVESSLKARGGNITDEPPILEKIRSLISEANEQKGRTQITTFNQIGMIYSFHHAEMQGILLGTSRVEQLKQSIDFYQLLKTGTYSDVYLSLQKILNQA